MSLPDLLTLLHLESVLIEYDRGTTFYREYAAKFEAYSHYQLSTRTTLPPILMVIQRPSAAETIRKAMHEVGADGVRVILAREAELLKHGLTNALPHPEEQPDSVCRTHRT